MWFYNGKKVLKKIISTRVVNWSVLYLGVCCIFTLGEKKKGKRDIALSKYPINPIPVGFRAANKGKTAGWCQNDTHSTGIGLCILFQWLIEILPETWKLIKNFFIISEKDSVFLFLFFLFLTFPLACGGKYW